jgi:proteasome lid subunit RPN8/RPN11
MSPTVDQTETYRALSITPLNNANATPVLYELTGESTPIGSADDNAIVLSDASIAAHHFAVREADGRDHLLVDLAQRWRVRDYTWRAYRPGDVYWCPRHGNFDRLDLRDWCVNCKQKRGSLWLMRPLNPGDTFDIGVAFRATYVVQVHAPPIENQNAEPPPEFPPSELFQVPAPRKGIIVASDSTIPVGTPPIDDTNLWRWQPDGIPFPIFMHHRVNVSITQHARQNREREVGGVLLGDVRVDEHGQMYVVVTHTLKAEFAYESRGNLTFTHETWLQIHAAHDALYPDKTIVGWYHTHPGWTIFLSPWDLFIHQNFFKQPWQIALVIDPSLDRAGFFVWKDNQINSPQKPIAPFRLAELDGWAESTKPRVRIKLTDTNAIDFKSMAQRGRNRFETD